MCIKAGAKVRLFFRSAKLFLDFFHTTAISAVQEKSFLKKMSHSSTGYATFLHTFLEFCLDYFQGLSNPTGPFSSFWHTTSISSKCSWPSSQFSLYFTQ